MLKLEQYVGTVLAQRYRIDKPIGVGGMGAVFEAFQLDLGRRVALKLLLGEADPGDLARFKTEALSVAAASHVNVVQLFEFSVEHDPPFLTMELLEGQTLHARMKQGPMPAKAAIDVAVQILSALQTAHAAGVIHRDLKPSNIFLTSNVLGIDLVKVLDFGIAKVVGTKGQTATGAVVGTPAYMAPEQLLGDPVDARSDVHAVGILLHEMISGQRAFTPGVDVAVRVVREVPPRLETLRPDVPRELADVVARALAKEPARRFEDARSMLEALDACRASLAPGAAPKDIAATTMVATERSQPPTTVHEPQTMLEGRTHQQTSLQAPLLVPAAQPHPTHSPRHAPELTGPSPKPQAAGGARLALFVIVPVVLLAALGGLVLFLAYSWIEEGRIREREELAKLTFRPCPSPSTCTGSVTVLDEKQSMCAAPPGATIPPYVNGDGVFIRDGSVTVFARITSTNKDGTVVGKRLSGYIVKAAPKSVLGRACRP